MNRLIIELGPESQEKLDKLIAALQAAGVKQPKTQKGAKLTDEELAKLFSYCARLSSMVAPAQAKKYYGFTFDGAVTDTFYGLAMLYGNELVGGSTAESFKQDEFYGPIFRRMMADIDRVLDGVLLVGYGDLLVGYGEEERRDL